MKPKGRSKKQFLWVDGMILEPGDKVWWTPPEAVQNVAYPQCKDATGNCRKPHEVNIDSVDVNDQIGTYLITSGICDYCQNYEAKARWVPAKELAIPGANAPAGSPLQVVSDLHAKINEETITWKDLKTQVLGLRHALLSESAQQGNPASGVCTTCSGDVTYVGGEWKHASKVDHSPSALLLT